MVEEECKIIETTLTDSKITIAMSYSVGTETANLITLEMNRKKDDTVAPLAIEYLAALQVARNAMTAGMLHYGSLLSQNREVLRQQDRELMEKYLAS